MRHWGKQFNNKNTFQLKFSYILTIELKTTPLGKGIIKQEIIALNKIWMRDAYSQLTFEHFFHRIP